MPGTRLAVVTNVVPAKGVVTVPLACADDDANCEADPVTKLPGETVADVELEVVDTLGWPGGLTAPLESLPRALATAIGIDVRPTCTSPFVTNFLTVETESLATVNTVVDTAFNADDREETELEAATADVQG
ncbi:hypothetical protein H2198_001401 [Neophaeococcomyces mojaviensis]|uniref:Uncharacterized protein n=1 Tax=Neophaeococcomyces mojaviensis TaxID=3383035 RepID=A0ACC3AHE4_9EURO|nr:hypothetical protein H2198_001401 [Knufia sp. JES_112]